MSTATKNASRKTATPKRNSARITAIANQKGGVGKTTTAHALLAGLKGRGYKVLGIDIDPQCNLTFAMNPVKTEEEKKSPKPNIYKLMTLAAELRSDEKQHKIDIAAAVEKAVKHTKQGDIIPGSLLLSGADMEFARTGRERLLTDILESLRHLYDYIIIDTPPALGILTINAMAAATDIIIPTSTDAFSVLGFEQLHVNICANRKHCNSTLKVAGLLMTKHHGQISLVQGVTKDIHKRAEKMGTKVFKTAIRESVEIVNAQLEQRSLFNRKSNNAVTDYLNFVEEYTKGANNA